MRFQRSAHARTPRVLHFSAFIVPSAPAETLLFLLLFYQFGSSSGYDDVCPVVMAASTPSGHYTQPVNVARNLTLYTRNLPPPVSPVQWVQARPVEPVQLVWPWLDQFLAYYIGGQG